MTRPWCPEDSRPSALSTFLLPGLFLRGATQLGAADPGAESPRRQVWTPESRSPGHLEHGAQRGRWPPGAGGVPSGALGGPVAPRGPARPLMGVLRRDFSPPEGQRLSTQGPVQAPERDVRSPAEGTPGEGPATEPWRGGGRGLSSGHSGAPGVRGQPRHAPRLGRSQGPCRFSCWKKEEGGRGENAGLKPPAAGRVDRGARDGRTSNGLVSPMRSRARRQRVLDRTVAPKSHVELLAPSASEFGLTWKQSHCS